MGEYEYATLLLSPCQVGDVSFRVKPRMGEYILLRKEEGPKVRCSSIVVQWYSSSTVVES